MALNLSKWRWVASFAGLMTLGGSAGAAEHTVEEVLSLQPVQQDVQIDRPTQAEIAKCTLKSTEREWIVKDPNGQILRRFVDTDGKNGVDTYSYFKEGIEVYRDIDTNQDKKADQYRWLNTAGIRWGLDPNQDGKIDSWKAISAEEVSAEVVAALRDRDRPRFERLLLTPAELKSLGLSAAKKEAISKRLEAAINSFNALANQRAITPDTKWVSFGGTQPGIVPAGTEDSTADLTVYENVAAMIESSGKAKALNVGCLVKVGEVWRLVDAPQLVDDKTGDLENSFVFIQQQRGDSAETIAGKPSAAMQATIDKLTKLPDSEYNRRADLLEELANMADTPEMRAQWYRQVADTLSAAAQTTNNQQIIARLKALEKTLQANPNDAALAFYVQFRWMTAEHGRELSLKDVDYAKVQDAWVQDLEQFVKGAGKYPESADAVMELAIAQEMSGQEAKAIQWYDAVVNNYPSSPNTKKAAGAKFRLTSIGRNFTLQGQTVDKKPFDISTFGKGKVVLVQYWATWSEQSKQDMFLLAGLKNKYKANFEVVGVCLDSNKEEMLAYLKSDPTPWPELFEPGGFDSRYANDLGIQTLPMMLLLDKQGKVVNRNIRAGELEAELKKLLSAK